MVPNVLLIYLFEKLLSTVKWFACGSRWWNAFVQYKCICTSCL